ncbi:MAG: UDP-N-acetylglucosamine 2-epimerase [Ignavibacteria bacterium GWF2_33_9]|nr:MAG: UDP-N-acetylglucosamine 2-epimerase [Ignavibacteria bacterium GWF2_33_9]
MKKILFIFGTRPEAIKLVPLINEFNKYPKHFDVKVCITSQHKEMLWQVLDFFGTKPDYNLELMKPNQNLFDITSNGLKKIEEVMYIESPDLVIVQGDTTSTFIGALASFYLKIPVAHIEAGLRSFNKYSPFPEEINRKMVSSLTEFHFPPTKLSAEFLFQEGFRENVFVVGNTVIDALFLTIEKIKKINYSDKFPNIDFNRRTILVTGHRRESFGKPFENICNALAKIAEEYKDINIIYPVHLNPNVQKPVNSILGKIPNVFLIEPQNYTEFIWLMDKSYLILTDSGGIQEEAPSLGKPVLVMREVTERTEGIDAGTAKLLGTEKENIIKNLKLLLDDESEYSKMSNAVNPYGDGKTSEKIVEIIKNKFLNE